ncbi:MAG: 2-C-methyl-D-erythritol 4-phosphate cytidylyltransferase [Candidatus Cloacimonetes bacterium]|jgi:2-C-methyl-D-erythritol 4-phosphate cytidylyltransferase|nr:2-C-methyl-D-erythritol 4-phosphate cytidylyltransferase [Candidatus Cloacimonadota bacterium]MBT6993979.1 2-C-methyl-D-erythritol 4-phosphate cytidylyltransferase [Candidatus Cloacimonadota bacterium]MBT7469280.1 2-C-methyl-D-erythritol 4-phosphate cytidylyltransferase [Candidatus Cloacimonadota bacterium]
MKNIAIITAGGNGSRLQNKTKKQFLEISGKPLIFWTIEVFVNHPEIDEIIVSLPPDEQKWQKKILAEFPKITFVEGGKERQDSVFNALKKCPVDTDFVLIHDGVRPFVSAKEISQLLIKVTTEKAVIPISKIKNTVKQIERGKIVKTVSRENLVNALTPQVFDFNLIFDCHKKAKNNFTDDAAILEHFDYSVAVLECSSKNFKITEPFDLEIAKYILGDK